MKRNSPNEPAESSPPPAKPTKKRSPMLVAASAAQKFCRLSEQIRRAQENIEAWQQEQVKLQDTLDPDACAIFDRMVGDE